MPVMMPLLYTKKVMFDRLCSCAWHIYGSVLFIFGDVNKQMASDIVFLIWGKCPVAGISQCQLRQACDL